MQFKIGGLIFSEENSLAGQCDFHKILKCSLIHLVDVADRLDEAVIVDTAHKIRQKVRPGKISSFLMSFLPT